jgi:hypothetical protein
MVMVMLMMMVSSSLSRATKRSFLSRSVKSTMAVTYWALGKGKKTHAHLLRQIFCAAPSP